MRLYSLFVLCLIITSCASKEEITQQPAPPVVPEIDTFQVISAHPEEFVRLMSAQEGFKDPVRSKEEWSKEMETAVDGKKENRELISVKLYDNTLFGIQY